MVLVKDSFFIFQTSWFTKDNGTEDYIVAN